MWTCSELKKSAWKSLSTNYWWAVLLVFLYFTIVSTATSFVSGISGAFSPIISIIISSSARDLGSNPSIYEIADKFGPAIIVAASLSAVTMIFTFILVIFFQNPLSCGVIKWFFIQREHKDMHSIAALFTGFQKENYRYFVSGMAWRVLWSSVWSLVSAIPILLPTALAVVFGLKANIYVAAAGGRFGISGTAVWTWVFVIFIILFNIAFIISVMINLNRYYAYLYVPYILIDIPDIPCREVLRRSRNMTSGQKGRMFILDLSFAGWWLLVFMTCGLLTFALMPYLNATYTELYFHRKEELTPGN